MRCLNSGALAARLSRLASVVLIFSLGASSEAGRKEINRPDFGHYLALWRITHDPAADDHANYHQQQCWSHDGRYLAYRHCPTVANPRAGLPYAGFYRPEVHVYDLLTDADRNLGLGISMLPGASWANHHNWLFYVELKPEDRGFAPNGGSPLIWVDLESDTRTKIGDGFDQIGGVDCNDQWIYGGIKDPTRTPAFRTARAQISMGGGVEELKDVIGFQWVVNPRFPLFSTRHDQREHPFRSTVSWWNLDGSHRRNAMLVLEAAHMTWQGNGEHFLIGDGLPRGRRWDEPAPSNVHVLASGRVGNLSACGHSGRFAVGDAAMFDLRSGDTWDYHYFLPGPLKPTREAYPTFDGEAKGSPDGTKVAFTVRYDMEKGPVAELTRNLLPADEVLHVNSTAAFPPSGKVVVWTEVIQYESKTATTFNGLTRGALGTRIGTTAAGKGVTEFTHHLLTDSQWEKVTAVGNDIRYGNSDPASPFLRQRGRDVYVAVVRRPDRPWVEVDANTLQIIPGESHYETAGYHLFGDGRRLTEKPLRAGEKLRLEPGRYSAVAVEWSGLESEPSNVVAISNPRELQVLADAPAQYQWSSERWLVDGKQVARERAASVAWAQKETVHRYDGVIARESHARGVLIEHDDLNATGKAIRRLTYERGKLALRDYYDRQDYHVSRQVFAPDGFITETIAYGHNNGGQYEMDHWWFERGVPVRRHENRRESVKKGDEWVTTPAGP